MPVEFVRETCTAYGHYIVCDSTKLIVAYDGSGRRISKTRLKKTAFDGPWYAEHVTHYTGIGTEVRENFAGESPETKVVVNMPEGLGRYGIEDADHAAENGSAQTFEWYLKNHLGSTMLVYGTGGTSGGLKAAYDYRSFGEQVTLTSPSTGKVTENFTGKERDDETQLNYFGARYLDPMLGMWISVDPKRQFVSPYLYAGTGYNPVNIIDPDGNEVELKNEQITMLGMINQASYNQYELDGNTLVEGSTCYEKGNAYFSERMDAAIYSNNLITVEMNPNNGKAQEAGEGMTSMTGDYGMPGANAQIVITGRPYGNSSAAQNLVHEFVSHAIPFILGDRKPNASAVSEEMKAIDGVFPPPNNVSDHPIYE